VYDRVGKLEHHALEESQRVGQEHAYTHKIIIHTKRESVRSGANENAVRSQDGVRRGGNRNFRGRCGERHRFDHEDIAFSPRFGGGEGANSKFLSVVSRVRRGGRLPDER